MTSVLSTAVLLSPTGSAVDDETVAVLTRTAPSATAGSTSNVRYTVLDVPGPIEPRSQTTVSDCTSAHTVVPLPSTPLTKLVPAGIVSVIVTSFACEGPALLTTMV